MDDQQKIMLVGGPHHGSIIAVPRVDLYFEMLDPDYEPVRVMDPPSKTGPAFKRIHYRYLCPLQDPRYGRNTHVFEFAGSLR
jgi:hypothetical protein